MRLNIRHTTTYYYDQPVLLGPHYFRLTPRADSYEALRGHAVRIVPQPVSLNASLESDGSVSHNAHFNGETKVFSVESRIVLDLCPYKNPFDFLITPQQCRVLPMVYPSQLAEDLKIFLDSQKVNTAVRHFADDILQKSKNDALEFLITLAKTMKKEFVYEFRFAGAPNEPQKTLLYKRGSCRDWALLYMAAARAVGLASRFVSGYYFDAMPQNPQLHAWVEVYIPGGGWKGFDPTLGLACYGRHIALASSASSALAAPIQGTFIGNAKAKMEVSLDYRFSSRQEKRKNKSPKYQPIRPREKSIIFQK